MRTSVPGRGRSLPSQALIWVALSVLLVLGVATVAGFLGGIWWVFDLAAALRTHYLLGFLLVGVVFGLVRLRAMVIVSLLGALVNAALILPLYLSGPTSPVEDSGVLRVMFLNTGISGADPDLFIEGLRSAEHDLVFLSAVTDRWASALGSASIPFVVAQSRPRGVDLELLVLARDDLPVETAIHDLGDGGRDMAVEAGVEVDGIDVSVFVMHPVSPLSSERAAWNRRQLEALASLAADRSDPTLIVGDLNATPWSPVFRTLLEKGSLLTSQQGFGVQASWPSWLGPLGIPIDHALHSAQLRVVERSLGPGYGSDHRSLHLVVALKESG